MRAALIGSGGPVLGREYMLDQPVVTIGRRDENTVVIKDPTVSRKHAEIRREGDDFLIVDKNSTSGVIVNGQPIAGEQPLRDGDRIGIGTSAVFLVQLQPAEEKTVTFSSAQLADQNRTQFITRTELEDPRAVPPAPPAANEHPAAPRAAAPEPRPAPPAEAAPPLFAPPPSRESAPPLAAPGGLAPAFDRDASPGRSVAQEPPPAPNFAPPSFAPPPANPPPPTFSAAPDVPRFGGESPAPPPFAPPPVPDGGGFGASQGQGGYMFGAPSAPGGGGFGAPSGGPSFTPPPANPTFAPPPVPGGPPSSIGVPSSASARKSSRMGLIIGLVVLLLLVIIAAVVVFLLLSGRLGG